LFFLACCQGLDQHREGERERVREGEELCIKSS
jgi:hypothetical protein